MNQSLTLRKFTLDLCDEQIVNYEQKGNLVNWKLLLSFEEKLMLSCLFTMQRELLLRRKDNHLDFVINKFHFKLALRTFSAKYHKNDDLYVIHLTGIISLC